MISLTLRQKWLEFRKRTFPLPNPKKMSNLSLSQIDNFAASIYTMALACRIDIDVIHFNRVEGKFFYDIPKSNSLNRYVTRETFEDFEMVVLFLEYLYNIDTKNKFCRGFVQFGSEQKFSQFWHFMTGELVYLAFKKIKKTQELIYEFFKKVKLGNDFRYMCDFWDKNSTISL